MIPVLRPELPSTQELLPYLRRIEDNAIASNDGPLVREFEARLGGVAVANATVGLELAAAYTWRDGGEVRVPAFTFPATATAVIRAGLTPVLCDVDRETWAAIPDERTLAVCPFGFKATGPLVDAAGAVGVTFRENYVRSFHATKPVPAGEGGMVFGDDGLLEYVRRARNFGFDDGMVSHPSATNAKMSEYHAAVALASLDKLTTLTYRRGRVARRYTANLKGRVELRNWVGGTIFPVLIDSPMVAARRLALAGFETRRWYCPTLDFHPAFAGLKREPLPVTHELASRLLCLPFHTFMTDSDIDKVCEVLCAS